RIVGLGAGGGNVAVLAAQALELGVDVVGVARATAVQDLQLAFYAEAAKRGYATGGFRIPKILAGPDAMAELASWPCDVVLNGVVGSLGLPPTLSALRCGRTLALANKGLEVIEAHELFDVGYDRIEVMVHPQSVIHSLVEFADGSTLAQCSPPDMRLPIALALGWPDRVPAAARAVDWTAAHTWEL